MHTFAGGLHSIERQSWLVAQLLGKDAIHGTLIRKRE